MHSVAGMFRQAWTLVRERPYRAPHHTASAVGFVGGGDPRGPARSRSPTTACSSSTSCRSSARAWRRCASRWRRPRHHRPRANLRQLPRPLHARRRDEPLPLRLARRPKRPLQECSEERVKRYRARVSGPLFDRIDLTSPCRPRRWPTSTRRRAGPRPRRSGARGGGARGPARPRRRHQRAAHGAHAPCGGGARRERRASCAAPRSAWAERAGRPSRDEGPAPSPTPTGATGMAHHLAEAVGYRAPGNA